MYDTLLHIGLVVGGGILIWLANWNIKMNDKEGRESSDARYWLKGIIGAIAAFFGILYLLRDLVSLF